MCIYTRLFFYFYTFTNAIIFLDSICEGEVKKGSFYWILPEGLSAEIGDMAFVETNQGPQIVYVNDVRQWGQKRINRFIHTVAEIHKREPEAMKKVIAIQSKPKNQPLSKGIVVQPRK